MSKSQSQSTSLPASSTAIPSENTAQVSREVVYTHYKETEDKRLLCRRCEHPYSKPPKTHTLIRHLESRHSINPKDIEVYVEAGTNTELVIAGNNSKEDDEFNLGKEKLLTILKNLTSKVSISLNIWRNDKNAYYMNIFVYYIDENWKEHKYLLDVCPLLTILDGVDMWRLVIKTLDVFGITDKTMACVYQFEYEDESANFAFKLRHSAMLNASKVLSRFLIDKVGAQYKDLKLNSTELDEARYMFEYLTDVYDATDEISSSEKGLTLGKSLFMLNCLLKNPKELNVSSPAWLKESTNRMIAKLKDLYAEMEYSFIYTCCILDPRIRNVLISEMFDSAKQDDYLVETTKVLANYEAVQPANTRKEKIQKRSFFEANAVKSLEVNVKSSVDNELTRYMKTIECTKITADPLIWWGNSEDTYPKLSNMARDYLCIVGMCMSPMDIFSSKGDEIHRKLCALSSSTIQYKLCLTSWDRIESEKVEDKGKTLMVLEDEVAP